MGKRLSIILVLLAAVIGLFFSCEQATEEVAVSSVTISQPTAEMIVGETLTLTATISPSNATDQEVTWASSKKSVAAVDKNGLVTAVASGDATITATAGGKRDQCTVIVKEPIVLGVKCVTGEATDIESTSAKLSGTVTIANAKDANGTACFYYSTKTGDVETIKKDGTKVDAGSVSNRGDSFTATISALTPETKYYFVAAVTIDGQEFYGEIKSFTSKEKPKDLSVTGAATDITEFAAKLSGYANLTPDLGVVTMGIIYSTNENPTLENSKELSSKELDGNNMYTVQAKDLNYNTTYYYKSFVQYGGIYRFGEIKTFTTRDFTVKVTTLEATDIVELSATLKGKLEVESVEQLTTTTYFLFSDTATSLETLKQKGLKLTTNVADGICSNNTHHYYSNGRDYFLQYNTRYYYVIYAKVHDKEVYGDVQSFTTLDIDATVTTESATSITELRATLNGKLNCANIKDNVSKSVWFLYSDSATNIQGLISNGTRINRSIEQDNTFNYLLRNLTPGTKYYYLACANLAGKVIYGDVVSFEAASINATVKTEEAENITEMQATLSGTLTVNCTESFNKEVWFYYSDVANSVTDLKSSGIKQTTTLNSDGSFKHVLTGLPSGKTYYYVACAIVKDREFTGELGSFKTKSVSASVTAEMVTDITEFKSTIKGKLMVESTEDLNKKAWIVYSSTANNLDNLKKNGTIVNVTLSSDGSFSLKLDNLSYNTQYYYVAGATVYDKTLYDQVRSFTTNDINASVSTANPTNVSESKATINGSLTVNSQESLSKDVWFLYSSNVSTLDALKSSGTKVSASLKNNDFSHTLEGLPSGTKYYYVACSKVHDKVLYGSVLSFTTKEIIAQVSSNTNNITELCSTLNGAVSVNTVDTFTKTVWFLYSSSANTVEQLTKSGIKGDSSLKTNGSFTYNLQNLIPSTQYYYIACVSVYDKVFYSDVQSFKTLDIVANITTLDPTSISESKATLNASLTVDSKESLSKSVWYLYSNSAATLNDLISTGTKAASSLNDNAFKYDMQSLSSGTNYYYVACAKVHNTTIYGDVHHFQTASITATFNNQTASKLKFHKATISSSIVVNSIESFNSEAFFIYSSTAQTLNELLTNGTKVICTLNNNTINTVLSSLTDNTTYYCVSGVSVYDSVLYGEVFSFTTPSYIIDLGLSVKWRGANIGAEAPEEFGYYYAWAETATKDENGYDWSTYKYWGGPSSPYPTKYTYYYSGVYGSYLGDKKFTLEPEDDAAAVVLGGSWRMPSQTEWEELISNCTWLWTTIEGVQGYLATSKKAGYTANSIFFPAAGRAATANAYLYYWTSSLNTGEYKNAYCAKANGDKGISVGSVQRYYGLSVRAVCD